MVYTCSQLEKKEQGTKMKKKDETRVKQIKLELFKVRSLPGEILKVKLEKHSKLSVATTTKKYIIVQ